MLRPLGALTILSDARYQAIGRRAVELLEALHPTKIWSDALTKLFELLSEITAPNAEIIRCTDNVV